MENFVIGVLVGILLVTVILPIIDGIMTIFTEYIKMRCQNYEIKMGLEENDYRKAIGPEEEENTFAIGFQAPCDEESEEEDDFE